MAEFHTRNEAGLRTPNGGSLGRVHYVVIHHTASGGAPTEWNAARWRALEQGEVARGYSSLAYHFGVNNGNAAIQESRGWGNRGAATGGTAANGRSWNDTSVAIVLDGNFMVETASEQALDAIADVIVLGVFLGFIDPDFEVWAHRDASKGTKWATACDGDNLYPLTNGFGSIAARARLKLEQAGQAAPVVVPTQAPAPPRCVRIASRRTLKQGDSGPSVKVLQNALKGRGFDPGVVDGRFGAKTKAAVECFQRASGLSVDGVVGPDTWAALGQ